MTSSTRVGAPWNAASVHRLLDLLTVARESDRLVVLASDHGHVHERGSRLESDASGGVRWRCSPRLADDNEVELTGPRVLLGEGRIVAAWNEKLRYGPIRNGYHGGASAQEIVIPLAVLAREELALDGWALDVAAGQSRIWQVTGWRPGRIRTCAHGSGG